MEDDDEMVAVVDADDDERELRLLTIEGSLGILHLRTGLEAGLPLSAECGRSATAKNSSTIPVDPWT